MHCVGSSTEVIYSLQTFGLPTKLFPVDKYDFLETTAFRESMTKRLDQERQLAQSNAVNEKDLIFIPGLFDVLLGRRKLSQEHVGNLRYRSLIASRKEAYESAKKPVKTAIASEIVQTVKDWGGRFLAEYYSDYVEVDDKKVCVRASSDVDNTYRRRVH